MRIKGLVVAFTFCFMLVADKPSARKSKLNPQGQSAEGVKDWEGRPVSKAKRRAEYWKNIKGLEFSHYFYMEGVKVDCFRDPRAPEKMHCYQSPEQVPPKAQ